MSYIETLSGTLAFITSFIGFVPQIYKTIQTKSTKDLSMTMLINYLVCSIAWIIYGSTTESLFVLSSNIIGLVTSAILIIQKRYYDSRQSA